LIKINLLPVKRAVRKVKAPTDEALMQIGIGMVVVLIFIGACGYRWQMLSDEVETQKQVKVNKTKELDDLKKKVLEVEDFEKKKRLLEDKNRIIEQLRKNQSGPVKLLDHLSQSLDPLKVWLVSVEGDSQVTVSGKALTNDDIVEFIRNLQRTAYFSTVSLDESVQGIDDGVTIYSFRIKMTVKG
jgi:type IV pilus assembly protein PilN